ncbi:MAG: hypothetical protein IKQ77_03050 [Prevotella sp.]|nr:hypothetical protein [Prevotella sp.]
MRTYVALLAVMLAIPMAMMAQNEGGSGVTVTGSIQSDVLFPQEDEDIGTMDYDHKVLTNSYADVHVMSKHVDAGARVEFMRFPLPGFENDFKGWGLANIYAKMHTDKLEVTLGNFYEQFGSGFILRTYEERSLGVDNSLLGARVMAKPLKGVTVKALSGWQRRYWSYNDALVSGGDLQLSIDQWSKALQDNGTYLSLGASMVNKHERPEELMWDVNHRLNVPENVNAFDFRASLQKGNISVLAEYAFKTQDPSIDNQFIYRKGQVAMLSASYSKRGMSLLLQAKRSDNMAFRSNRMERGISSYINHMPAFTLDHTYALAALYPYATQPDGEWAYQAELGYNFKRNTFLGGKYGTNVKVNFSHVHSIDKNIYEDGTAHDTNGYGSAFWKWGDGMYYQDLDIQVDKRITKAFKLNLMYMNQFYNKTVIEGEGGMVHSDIFVADGKYKFNNKVTLRGELQYLATNDDEGDWAFALLELSVLPRLMFTVSDMYNCGETDLHYYQGLVTFTYGAHRLQAGYGRTRAGYNCSGGVCRYVPATKGFTLSYNYNF